MRLQAILQTAKEFVALEAVNSGTPVVYSSPSCKADNKHMGHYPHHGLGGSSSSLDRSSQGFTMPSSLHSMGFEFKTETESSSSYECGDGGRGCSGGVSSALASPLKMLLDGPSQSHLSSNHMDGTAPSHTFLMLDPLRELDAPYMFGLGHEEGLNDLYSDDWTCEST